MYNFSFLAGWENGFLTSRRKCIKMLENRVQGRLSGPKMEEINGGRRKVPNKELQNSYYA
jgi:hypothetical protein